MLKIYSFWHLLGSQVVVTLLIYLISYNIIIFDILLLFYLMTKWVFILIETICVLPVFIVCVLLDTILR